MTAAPIINAPVLGASSLLNASLGLSDTLMLTIKPTMAPTIAPIKPSSLPFEAESKTSLNVSLFAMNVSIVKLTIFNMNYV